MKELEYLELQEVGIEEIISFSKLNTSPSITILDDLNYGLFNQVSVWANELKLIFFIIKGTRKIAFIGNHRIALKIAKVLQIKAQVMYYSLLEQRDSNYIVNAFGENGEEIEPFIETDINNVPCDILSKYAFEDLKYAMRIRGSGDNKIESLESVKISRQEFLKNGKIK